MYGLRDSDLECIHQAFKRYPNIQEAVLFGSRAKGTYHPGSDVDIALKGTNLKDTVLALSIYLNQESIMPYEFDLIDYQAIDNKELLEHIDRVGIPVYKVEFRQP